MKHNEQKSRKEMKRKQHTIQSILKVHLKLYKVICVCDSFDFFWVVLEIFPMHIQP